MSLASLLVIYARAQTKWLFHYVVAEESNYYNSSEWIIANGEALPVPMIWTAHTSAGHSAFCNEAQFAIHIAIGRPDVPEPMAPFPQLHKINPESVEHLRRFEHPSWCGGGSSCYVV